MSTLIYSHQRCGSTNALYFAQEFVADAPDGMEILNPKRMSRTIPGWRRRPYRRLTRQIADVYRKTPVVKHIYGAHTADIESLVLSNLELERIVLLRRENRPAAALSALVAQKTKQWHSRPTESVGTINPQQIRLKTKKYQEAAELAETMCTRSGKPFVTVSYEELYPEDTEARRRAARKFLTDLFGPEFTTTEEEFETAFSEHLAPTKKVGTTDTRKLVDNIDEIVEEFPDILN